MALGIVFIVVRANRFLPAAFKSGARFLYCGMGLYFVCSVMESLYAITHSPIDFNLVGTCICQILFYFATFTHGYDNYHHIRKSEVFNLIDEVVFMLNNDDRIADYNLPAKRFLAMLEVEQPESKPFKELIEPLIQEGKMLKRQESESQNLDIYIPAEFHPHVYSMRTQPYYDQHGLPDGRFIYRSGHYHGARGVPVYTA